jgi:hypothetical protein
VGLDPVDLVGRERFVDSQPVAEGGGLSVRCRLARPQGSAPSAGSPQR